MIILPVVDIDQSKSVKNSYDFNIGSVPLVDINTDCNFDFILILIKDLGGLP